MSSIVQLAALNAAFSLSADARGRKGFLSHSKFGAIIAATLSGDVRVAAAALRVVARIGRSAVEGASIFGAVTHTLSTFLRHDEPLAVSAALASLREASLCSAGRRALMRDDVFEALKYLLCEAEPTMRAKVAESIRFVGLSRDLATRLLANGALPYIAALLDTPFAHVRVAALRGLYGLLTFVFPDADAAHIRLGATLVRLLADAEASTRGWAGYVLENALRGVDTKAQALEAGLMARLRDLLVIGGASVVGGGVLAALSGFVGNDVAMNDDHKRTVLSLGFVDVIVPMANDPSPNVHMRAGRLLSKLLSPRVIDVGTARQIVDFALALLKGGGIGERMTLTGATAIFSAIPDEFASLRGIAFSEGAVDILCSIFSSEVDSECKAAAANAISNLCRNRAARTSAVRADVAPKLVAALAATERTPERASIAAAIATIGVHPSASRAFQTREVIRSLKTLLYDPLARIVGAGAAALSALALAPEGATLVLSVGCLSPLTTALAHPSPAAHAPAALAFAALSTHPPHASLLRSVDGFPLLLALLDPPLADAASFAAALRAVAVLARDPPNRSALISAGVVPRVVAHLAAPEVALSEEAARALAALGVDERGREEAAAAGAAEALVACAFLEGGAPRLQAARAMASLCLATTNMAVGGWGLFLPPLLALLRSEWGVVKKMAACAIRAMTFHEKMRRELVAQLPDDLFVSARGEKDTEVVTNMTD